MIRRSLYRSPETSYRNPLENFQSLVRQMDMLSDLMSGSRNLRDPFTSGVFPLINLTEDTDNYYARAELPGIESGDLDIQIDGKNLTISGERNINMDQDVKFRRRERESGKFSRVISLPGEVDPDKVEAGLTNGLLNVKIPKAEAAKPKRITIG